MKKVYVGIDAHKDENVFGSAYDGRCRGELIGKCSADLNRTLTFTAEVGDMLRFPHPKKFMGFLGMVPKENRPGGQLRC